MAFLEIRGLSKTFPGVTALDGVDLAAEAGEVHALVGANGAGKSTLMNVLAGVLSPNTGEIRLAGRPVAFAAPRAAREAGVSIVYQESSAIPDLTVAENIFLGREPSRRLGLLDRRRLYGEARRLLDHYHLPLDPAAPVRHLSVAGQQLVEIARALSISARILILDEPTAVLSLAEQRNLFDIIAGSKGPHRLILYVSHRLEEVLAIADRITVLRDGRKVATVAAAGLRQADLVRLMVGHDLRESFPLPAPASSPPLLDVAVEGNPARLQVRRGEIVGLAGLVGAGRSRLGRALGGLEPIDLRIDGRPVRLRSPADALAHGIVYLTEDRKGEGLFANLSVLVNTTAAALPSLSRLGVLSAASERAAGEAILGRLRLVARSLGAPVRELSGGNQQKVIFGRALLGRPRVLVCDEPTRGIDVGAKDEIYELLIELARQGVAIVLISSEMKEVLALSHRIVVMRDGRVVREFAGDEAKEHDVLMAAMGPTADAA
jgi:ABC-type sugar transport system ATPase subunit